MDNTKFINQLDLLLDLYRNFQQQSKHNDLSDLSKQERQSLVSRGIAAIHRITGLESTFSQEIKRLIGNTPALHGHTSSVMGVVLALREDLNAGYMQTLAEMVHADVFSDFLDMATHLNDLGYKDPAAVLAGSTLESHLKKLCIKNVLPIEQNGKHIKADKLNADLAKANAINLLDQKNVTAWLGLRNKAAHGQYADYTSEQVKLQILGIVDFIARNPA
jgi:hypothetical protein